jgi:uncharacterized protein (DUF58 family)
MTRVPGPRAGLFAVVGITGLVGGLAVGRPELVAIGAPFLLLLGLAHVLAGDHGLAAVPESGVLRIIEGQSAQITVTLTTAAPAGRLEIRAAPPSGLVFVTATAAGGIDPAHNGAATIGLPAAGSHRVQLDFYGSHWGTYPIHEIEVFRAGPLGVFGHRLVVPCDTSVTVYPRPATVRRLLRPVETHLGFGDLVSRHTGTGLEYADLREMQPGDDPRLINWKAAARGRGYWVNVRHPERNSDIVLFVDTLAEARRGVEALLDFAVRAAAGLARSHLGRHDRIGLVTFGEPVRWLLPGMGDVQRYRVLDTLMQSRTRRQMYWRGIDAIPRRALPPQALVVGLSPLLDDRSVHAFADLRGRGFDVAVVELAPEHFVAPAVDAVEASARRIWMLQRDAIRRTFRRHGVAVVPWNPDEPFETALAEVEVFRRNAQRARA